MNVTEKPSRRPCGLGPIAAAIAAAALLCAAFGAAPAAADFGLNSFDVTYTNEDGTPATQAGTHPFAQDTYFGINYSGGFFEWSVDGELKDGRFDQVPGFVGDSTAIPHCSTSDFLGGGGAVVDCPLGTQVGVVAVPIVYPIIWFGSPVWNLEPPPGVAVRLGFQAFHVRVVIDVGVNQEPPYNVVATQTNVPQILAVFGARLQLWGNPADPAHDHYRFDPDDIACWHESVSQPFNVDEVEFLPEKACSVKVDDPEPFLTLPTACDGPKTNSWEADSWQNPGVWVGGSVETHDDAEPPNPQGFTTCGKVPFKPQFEVEPSSKSAESPTGLDVNLDFDQEGLTSVGGTAQSTAKKVVATLPEGVTINPSVGEGLGYCSPEDYERESLDVKEGEGCPNESKIGTAEVETPLLDTNGPIEGSLYLAQQGDESTPELENPFDSLIAVYIVLREPRNGIFVKIPMKVEPDPNTGQLVSTVDDIPQLPFSHFNLHFREGKRSPLSTPSTCGSYDTVAQLYPWSDPDNAVTAVSTFEVTGGIGGGDCPPGGIPPFSPDFEAGSTNNNAASYSPFSMRLIRHDGEQDMTKFGSILPPGVVGNLSGVEKCSEEQIAAARGKTGRQEQAAPSCPAGSQIGTTKAGAGVGPALTYVPGKVYLAGPYKGAPLSVVSITPAVAGPFDAGAVVVRIALDLNPTTAEVEVDGDSSDPIPHILKGIPLKVRDLRVYVDRESFIVNPTSCDESSARATLFGAYLDLFSDADDVPADLSTRYQAANCLNLGFAPKLAMRLKGKNTKRGGHPGLRAIYSPTAKQANVEDLVVRLPRSAFLDQSHIRTICTRVQFAADQCPKAAQYGYIRAWTPLLDEPLQGPVWLRSSNNKLPDLVFDLHGLVDVEVATRLDSIRGGIRARVENAPDAPLSRVILNMQGAKKGLIINSRDLCKGKTARASAQFDGHNGKRITRKPVMRPQCGRKAKHSSHRRARVAKRSSVG